MKLVHVIPIAKGISKDKLTYFTNQDIVPGSVISVPLRNRIVPAILVSSESVMGAKQSLKGSSYAMRKIEPKSSRMLFLPQFMDAVFEASSFFATSPGATLSSIVPKILLDEAEKIPEPTITTTPQKQEIASERLMFGANESVRHADYKSLVREEFAKNSSIFITVPTIRDAEELSVKLSKGIEEFVFVLHSELTPKEVLKRVSKCVQSNHPALIIATPSFLSIPKTGIGTIIVERESARGYKLQRRPYIHMRKFAEIYAEKIGARIIFADMPLSIETMWMTRQREYEEWNSTRTRIESEADQYIIDMRGDAKTDSKIPYSPLSDELVEHIKLLEPNERSFIFNVRRGIAPSTICEDCGSIVLCEKCEAPVVLHASKQHNVFLCHRCGTARSAKERCKTCSSWKLKALGVGVEAVKQELKNKFGEKKVFAIDSDSTKTYKQASKVAQDFYKTNGAILVGTELSLSFIKEPVALSAIASLDSLLSIPDPKINEHIFSLITRVRSIAKESFFLQTRQPELPVINYATNGNVSGFYEMEILSRKRFDYPPFSILVKISAEGKPDEISNELLKCEEQLQGYNFIIYPGFTPSGNGKYVLHGLIKVPYASWPDLALIESLKSLPLHLKVNVLPESTL